MTEPNKQFLNSGEEEICYNEATVTFYESKMDEEFIRAAKKGDLAKVTQCIQNGVNINVKNPGGLNALHLASRENHVHVVRYLLQSGINKNAITKRLNTALHIACLGGNTQIAEVLIEEGFEVNVQAQDGITPLYMAAQENHLEIVQLLLKHNADIHMPAKGGFEPADVAALQGHTEVTMNLLEHNSKGFRAFHMASKKDDTVALTLILKEIKNVNDRLSNGYTALHIAAKHGCIKAAHFLLEHGADVNAAAKCASTLQNSWYYVNLTLTRNCLSQKNIIRTVKNNVMPLHVASRHGQVGVLKQLIEAGANLEIPTKDGLTALHCAAREGHEHCVELLVVHGAPLTAKTKHGLTALHMASQGNHRTSAQHLLAHGAHIDDLTQDGVTSLHVTSHYGNVETAKLLIEKGTDINKRARNGYTALHIASKKNREEIVRLLLKHKVSVFVKNNNGQTPLHVAAYFGHINIVLLLIQSGASLESTTLRDETVLHIACRTPQLQVVRLLLRNGAKINQKTKDQDTPLHIACRQGNTNMVSLLLDYEANPNITDKNGCTPLHLSCRMGDLKSVESLLDHHADITIAFKGGNTALHEASKTGDIAIIGMLLDQKADVNAKGKNNLTPLHMACHYDQPNAALALLNRNADPHVQAKNGFTPLHISAKKNQVQLTAHLLDHGVEANLTTRNGISPLHFAVQEGNFQIVNLLLDNGASPGSQTTNGLTPLHVAVHYNQIGAVKELLKHGSNINSLTQNGFAPLHLAALYGHCDVAELLLKDGADVEPKTKNGNTPLHLAAYHGHVDVIELLLRYNAPPNSLNKDGYSPYCISKVLEKNNVAEVLAKVTTVAAKIKKGKEKTADQIKQTFPAPDSLEGNVLLDAGDEAEEEVHFQKKIVEEDFEETFAGLDESKPKQVPLSAGGLQVNEEDLQILHETIVESVDKGYENLLNEFDSETQSVESVTSSSSRYIKSMSYADNIYITEPPRHGTFLSCFYVDARGGTMESKTSGIEVSIPRGAVTKPTRIVCSRDSHHDVSSSLHATESVVSHVFKLSPCGGQFLKPVILEIPHFASLSGSDRELIALRCDVGCRHWKEHVSALIDNEKDVDNDRSFKMKVIIQEIPDKLLIISRPRKERFVMSLDGGTVQSRVAPKVKIIFSPNTLNTSTKIFLQVQTCDSELLPKDGQTFVSPVVNLEPAIHLTKPVTINMPCSWLDNKDKGNKKKLRLLAWLSRSPRQSTDDCHDYEWQDITNIVNLLIDGDNVSFTTTEFTRYWLIQTDSTEILPKTAARIEQLVSLSFAPFSARFYVYGRINKSNKGDLQIYLVDDESAFMAMIGHYRDITELAKSPFLKVYANQIIHVKLSGNFVTAQDNQCLKFTYHPLRVNRLNIKTDVITTDSTGRLTFSSSSRSTDDKYSAITTLCHLDIQFSEEMLLKRSISPLTETINDPTIQLVGQATKNTWMRLATELDLNKRDKQAVLDISSGKNDEPSVILLEYWRAKYSTTATYKALYDALVSSSLQDEAELVFRNAPIEVHGNLPSDVILLASSPLNHQHSKDHSPPSDYKAHQKGKLMTIPAVSFDLMSTDTSPVHVPNDDKDLISPCPDITSYRIALNDFEKDSICRKGVVTVDDDQNNNVACQTFINDPAIDLSILDKLTVNVEEDLMANGTSPIEATSCKAFSLKNQHQAVQEDTLSVALPASSRKRILSTEKAQEEPLNICILPNNVQAKIDFDNLNSLNSDADRGENIQKPLEIQSTNSEAPDELMLDPYVLKSSTNIDLNNHTVHNFNPPPSDRKMECLSGSNVEHKEKIEQQITILDERKQSLLILGDKLVVKDMNKSPTNEEEIEKGEDLIKKMFGNQASVMGFFVDGEDQQVDEDYSCYGTQV